jgi:hypothetical protein
MRDLVTGFRLPFCKPSQSSKGKKLERGGPFQKRAQATALAILKGQRSDFEPFIRPHI